MFFHSKKEYLIIGATGSLGTSLIRKLYDDDKISLTVFSRDELKQSQLKKIYPNLKYVLGDIRDPFALRQVTKGKDVVFHVAALKQINTLQKNVRESILTNVFGTMNVADACIENDVEFCVFCSTDKAVLPINAYGYSKGLASSLLWDLNEKQAFTKFKVFVWGNIIGSRGSVIPEWVKSLKERNMAVITNDKTRQEMTRFWLTIEDAVNFMINNFKSAPHDRAMIPPMKSASIEDVIKIIASILKIDNYQKEYVGIRPGEKLHECVFSSHDYCLKSDTAPKYTDEELYKLFTPYVLGIK